MPWLLESPPVARAPQSDADAVRRDLREGQVIRVADLHDPAVLDAVGLPVRPGRRAGRPAGSRK